MKLIKVCLLFFLCILVFAGCNKNSDENGGMQDMRFGGNITITVAENEIIDAEYIQKILDGEIKKDTPYFDLWDGKELQKMIDYMKQNNFHIVPGKYTFNQAWTFDNGCFVLNSGKKREVFKFQHK